MLEIGPGLGPLTELLVEQAGEVLAIEKDARLVEVLKQRFTRTVPPVAHRRRRQARLSCACSMTMRSTI